MAVETITYNGKEYTRIKGKWVDKNYMSATNKRRELDATYYKTLDLDKMSIEEIMKLADEFKDKSDQDDPNSPNLAANLYNRIIGSCDGLQLFGLFSKLSSCYRQLGQPQRAIDLYEKVKEDYGVNLVSSSFLTSVGAAYCDLRDYVKAKAFADRAYAKSGGKSDPELNGLYGRIRKETTGSGKYDG